MRHVARQHVMPRHIMRWLVVFLALSLPLLGVYLVVGPPATLDPEVLEQWSPLRQPGPTASLMASAITSLAGFGRQAEVPPWFDADVQALVDNAKQALRDSNFKQATGHLLLLSDRLEDHGVQFEDFLAIILPDILPELVAWLLAHYFAPVLLGLLMVVVVTFVLGPWLIRQLYLLLKALLMLTIAIVGAILIVSLAFTLASHQSLIFALIEYLAAVACLLILGHLILGGCTVKKFAPEKLSLRKGTRPSENTSPDDRNP